MKKTAVVLLNLGGPDSLQNVRPFLFNLFYDRSILSLPNPFRYFLAKFISSRRESKAQGIYQLIGGESPIVEQTEKQRKALEERLRTFGEYKVFMSMRYWHPMSDEVTQKVKEYNPDEIVLLPLYPQFSSTTTASSFKDWENNSKKIGLTAQVRKICCYYNDELFANSYAELIRPQYEEAKNDGEVRILFSAHGIPQNRIEQGDPYEWQVIKSVEAIVNKLAIEDLDYKICYQSKVGPLKWLSPPTDGEIIKAARDGKAIVIVPVAFVSEHSETLVELDIEYKHLADQHNAPGYYRVQTVQDIENYIELLANLCKNGTNSLCKNVLNSCKDRAKS